MPGEFTRPRDERGRFISARDFIAAEEAERPGAVTQRDMDFQAENGGQEAPPPPLPRVRNDRGRFLPNQGAEQSPQPEPPPEEEEGGNVAGAVQGAKLGAKAGVVGAVVGGAAGFLAGRKSKPPPIGTLEGTVGGQDGGLGDTMRELLAVQQGIARLGSPVKDAITTDAPNSRM